jgi:hypothetical protein
MHIMPGVLGGIVLAGIVAGIQGSGVAKAILITSSIAQYPRPQGQIHPRWTMGASLAVSIALAFFKSPSSNGSFYFPWADLKPRPSERSCSGCFGKGGIIGGSRLCRLENDLLCSRKCRAPPAGSLGAHPSLFSVPSSVLVHVIVSLMTVKPSEQVLWMLRGKPRKIIQAKGGENRSLSKCSRLLNLAPPAHWGFILV